MHRPIVVGRRYNVTNPDSRVLCAQWHPLSRFDTHILLLSDDSVLRYSHFTCGILLAHGNIMDILDANCRRRLYNLSDMKRENGVLRVDRAEQTFNVYARDNYAQAVTFAMSRDTSGWGRCVWRIRRGIC